MWPDFVVTDTTVSAQYDDEQGRLGALVEIDRPAPTGLPLKLAAANFCAFRGMLMKSTIYFEATGDVAVGPAPRLLPATTAAVRPAHRAPAGRP